MKRYQNGVVGWGQPRDGSRLDSYGFQDLEISIQFHVALTSGYRDDNIRKFKLNTPTEVWWTMTRCWKMEPTSQRIIADIEDWPRVLGVIIASKGCVVHGEAVRSSHRYQRLDGKGPMASQMKSHDRIALFSGWPVHSDAQAAFESLTESQEQW